MELYGIDLPVTVRINGEPFPMVMRIPGWVNFGILRAVAVPLTKTKRRP